MKLSSNREKPMTALETINNIRDRSRAIVFSDNLTINQVAFALIAELIKIQRMRSHQTVVYSTDLLSKVYEIKTELTILFFTLRNPPPDNPLQKFLRARGRLQVGDVRKIKVSEENFTNPKNAREEKLWILQSHGEKFLETKIHQFKKVEYMQLQIGRRNYRLALDPEVGEVVFTEIDVDSRHDGFPGAGMGNRIRGLN